MKEAKNVLEVIFLAVCSKTTDYETARLTVHEVAKTNKDLIGICSLRFSHAKGEAIKQTRVAVTKQRNGTIGRKNIIQISQFYNSNFWDTDYYGTNQVRRDAFVE